MQETFYDEIAPIYDRMILWERRLKLEAPAFESLWRATGPATLLDAACGSGRHLVLFRRQWLTVTGSDASPAMLELARAQVAPLPEAERPALIQSAWSELPEKVPGRFDAVLCLGNSLPYATDPAARQASLEGLWSRVAPGGFLLIQFRNFAGMRARGERYLPLSQTLDREAGQEYVCLRQYEWHAATVDFNIVILSRALGDPAAPWTMRTIQTPLATLDAESVAEPLRQLGAQVRLHGSLALEPYDPAASDDVVIQGIKK